MIFRLYRADSNYPDQTNSPDGLPQARRIDVVDPKETTGEELADMAMRAQRAQDDAAELARQTGNPTHARMLDRYFQYEHLPEELQGASKPFCETARDLVVRFELATEVGHEPDPAECTVALRKLLEAKDAGVRTFIPPKK